MRGMKGKTHPYAMNRKKYKRQPRTWEDARGSILGLLEDQDQSAPCESRRVMIMEVGFGKRIEHRCIS